MLATIAVVIDVVGRLGGLLAQHHGVRLLGFLRFSGRFGRRLTWSILLGNSIASADAIDHVGFPSSRHIGSQEQPLEMILGA